LKPHFVDEELITDCQAVSSTASWSATSAMVFDHQRVIR
jgi:hypothetical protein